MDTEALRNNLSSAIRFWEPMRIVYNGVLAVIVVVYFMLGFPSSKTTVSLNGLLILFLFVVLANVAYCAAHVVDVFVQSSGYRQSWRRVRWILFAIGLVFAGILTRFWSMAMFSVPFK